MAIGTVELAIANLDTMDDERLVSELKKSKEELFNLRFRSATDQLDNHGRLKAVRRDVARIYTILRERDLGIRTAPSPVSVSAAADSEPKADTDKVAKADKKADKQEQVGEKDKKAKKEKEA